MAMTVDERVVEMRFDNQQFEKNISQSIKSLDELDKALKFDNAGETLSGISKAAKEVDLSSISDQLEKLEHRFSFVGERVHHFFNQMVDDAKRFVSQFTIEPVKLGLDEYEEKMDAIKLAMANTGEDLSSVKETLEDLNIYADRTIYKFADMTSNLGKFTAQGIGLKDSADAIRGISNLAAVTGANTEAASRAMYNFSQALAIGKMELRDWKTMENTGMGNKEFREQVILTAKELGYFDRQWKDGQNHVISGTELMNEAYSSFRETLKYGWMDNELMLATLKKYGDETTDIGKKAYEAATEITTLTKLIDVTIESFQSQWAYVWEAIIGDYEEAKRLWTAIGSVITEAVDNMFGGLRSVIAEWQNFGGRNMLIEGLAYSLGALQNVLRPLKEAFREVFPAVTGRQIADMTRKFRDFAKSLRMTQSTYRNLKSAFKGILTVVKVLGSAMSGLIKIGAKPLFTIFKSLVTAAISIAGALGKVITRITDSTSSLQALNKIANGVAVALQFIANVISRVIIVTGSFVAKLIEIVDVFAILKGIGITIVSILSAIAYGMYSAVAAVVNFVQAAYRLPIVQTTLTNISKAIKTIGTVVKTVSIVVIGAIALIVKTIADFSKKYLRLDNLKKIFTTVITWLGNAKDAIVDFFKKIKEGMHPIEFIKDKISELKDKLGELKDKVIDFLEKTGIKSFFEQFEPILTKVKDGFKGITDSIRDFLSTVSPAKILAFGLMVSFLILFAAINKVTTAFADLAKQASMFTANVNAVLRGLTAKTMPFLNFSKGIALIAGSLALLTMVDTEKLKSVAAILGVFTVVVGGFSIAMELMAKKLSAVEAVKVEKILASVGRSLLMFAGSIAVLAIAFNIIETVDIATALTKFGLLIVLGGILAGFAALLNKINPKLNTGMLGLLIFAISLEKVVNAFVVLSGLHIENAKETIIIIAEIAAIMAGLAFASKGLGITSALSLLAMCMMLEKIMPKLQELGMIDLAPVKKAFEENIGALIAVGAFAVTMSYIAGKFGKNLAKLNNSFMALGITMILLGATAKILASIPKEDFTRSVVSIGIALVLFALIEVLSSMTTLNNMPAFGKGMIMLGVAMVLMGAAVKLISDIPESSMWKAAAVVGGALALFALLEKFSASTKEANIKAIAALCVGMVGLGVELIALSVIPWQDLVMPTISMGVLMLALGGAVKSIGSVKDIKLTTFGTLLTFVGSMVLIGATMAMLAEYDWKHIIAAGGAMSGAMLAMAAAMKIMGSMKASLSFGDVAGILAMSVSLIPIASAISLVANYHWDEIGAGVLAMAGVFALMTGAMLALSKWGGAAIDMVGAGAGLIAMASAILILAVAFKYLEGVEWDNISSGVILVGGAFIVLSVFILILQIFSKEILILAAAFAVFGGACLVIAGAVFLASYAFDSLMATLDNYRNVHLENLVEQLTALVPVMVKLAGAMALVGLAGILLLAGMPGLLAFGAVVGLIMGLMPGFLEALSRFKTIIEEMATTDTSNLAKVLSEIAVAFLLLIPIAIEAGVGAIGILALSVAMLALGAGAALTAATVPTAAVGLKSFVDTIRELIDNVNMAELAKDMFFLATALAAIGVAGMVLTLGVPGLLLFSFITGDFAKGLAKLADVIATFPIAQLYYMGQAFQSFTAGRMIALTILAIAMPVLASGMAKVAAVLPGLAHGVMMLASAFAGIATFPVEMFTAKSAEFIGILLILTALGPKLIPAAMGFNMLAESLMRLPQGLFAFGVGMSMLTQIPQSYYEAFINFANMLGNAAVGLISGGIGMGIAGPGLEKLAQGLNAANGPLLYFKAVCSGFDFETIGNSLIPFGDGLIHLAEAGFYIGFVAKNLTNAGKGISDIAVGVSMLSNMYQNRTVDLPAIADYLNQLQPSFKEMAKYGKQYAVAGNGIRRLGEGFNMFNEPAQELVTIAPDFPIVSENMGVLVDALDGAGKDADEIFELGNAIRNLAYGFEDLADSLDKDMSSLIKDIVKSFEDLDDTLREAGKDAILGLYEGLTDATEIDKVKTQSKSIADNVVEVFRKIWDWHSPAGLFEGAGKDILAGLYNGLGDRGALSSLLTLTSKVANGVTNVFRELWDWHSPPGLFLKAAKGILSALTSGMSDSNLLGGLFNASTTAGEGVGNGILNGIKNTIGKFDLVGWISNLVGIDLTQFGFGSGSGADPQVTNDVSSWLDSITGKTKNYKGTAADAAAKTYEMRKALGLLDEELFSVDDILKDVDFDLDDFTGGAGGAGGAASASSEDMEKLKHALDALHMTTDVFAKEYGDLLKSMGITDAQKAAQVAFESLGMTLEQFGDFWDSMESKAMSALDNIFDAPADRGWMDKNAILSNMRENLNQVSQWADTLGRLAERGLNQGLYQKLAEMGPQGYKYVHAFMEMTDDELSQAGDMYEESLTLPTAAANRISAGFLNAGLMATQGLANGLKDMAAAKEQALADGEGVVDSINEGAGVQSPSWKTEETGMYLMQGLENGILNNLEPVLFAVQVVTDRIITDFEVKFSSNRVKEIGQKLLTNIASGMVLSADTVSNIVSDVLNGITLAINTKANELIQNGRYICQYLVQGFREEMNLQEGEIDAAIDKLVEFAIDHATKDHEKDYIKISQFAVEAIVDELINKKTTLKLFKDTLDDLLTFIIEKNLRSEETYEMFVDAGGYWMEGLAEGIIANAEAPISAAEEVARQIVMITQSVHETASPSKVAARIGKWWDEGLAKGIDSGAKDAYNSARALADGVVKISEITQPKVKKAFEKLFDGVDEIATKKVAKTVSKLTNSIQVFHITDSVAKAFVPVNQLVGETADNASKAVSKISFNLYSANKTVEQQIKKAIKWVNKFDDDLMNLDGPEKLIKPLQKINKYFSDFNQAPKKVLNFLEKLKADMKPVNNLLKVMNSQFYNQSESFKKFTRATNDARIGIIRFGSTLMEDTEAGKEYAQALEDMAKAEEALNEAREKGDDSNIGELEEAYEVAASKVTTYANAVSKAVNEYKKNLKIAIRESIDLFKEFNFGETFNPTQVLSNMFSHYKGISDWSGGLAKLATNGLAPEIIKQLADENVESYDKVMSLAAANPKTLALINSLYDQRKKAAKKAAKEAVAAIAYAYGDEAAAARKAMADMIDDGDKAFMELYQGNLEHYREFLTQYGYGSQQYTSFIQNMQAVTTDLAGVIDIAGERMLGFKDASKSTSSETMILYDGLINLGDVFGVVAEEAQKTGNYIGDVTTKFNEWLGSVKEGLEIRNPFEKFNEDLTYTADQLKYNMNSQLTAVKEFADNIHAMSQMGYSPEVIKYISSLGYENGLKYTQGFVNASKEDVGYFNDAYKEMLTIPDELSKEIGADLLETGTEIGKALQEGVAKAFKENGVYIPLTDPSEVEEAVEAASETGAEAGEAYAEEFTYMSVDGVENGITNAEPKLITVVKNAGTEAGTEAGKAASTALSDSLGSSSTQEAVKQNTKKVIIYGVTEAAKGVQAETSGVLANMFANVDTSVLQPFADAVVKIIGGGFEQAASKAVSEFNDAVNKIKEKINQIPKEIKIKVYVDTTEIDTAITKMNQATKAANDMANAARAAAAAAKAAAASTSSSSSSSGSSSSGSSTKSSTASTSSSSGTTVNMTFNNLNASSLVQARSQANTLATQVAQIL